MRTDNETTGTVDNGGAGDTANAAVSTSTTTDESTAGQGQGEAGTTATTDTGNGEGESQGAPEQYAAFNLAEGYVLDGERLATTQALFKDLDLSQDNAQKLVDAFVKADGENQSAFTQLAEQVREQRVETWGSEAETELGDQYDAAIASAKSSLNGLRTENPKLYERAMTALSKPSQGGEGWGNHPVMIQLMAFYGRKLGASPMQGLEHETSSAGAPRSHADRIYGSSNQS